MIMMTSIRGTTTIKSRKLRSEASLQNSVLPHERDTALTVPMKRDCNLADIKIQEIRFIAPKTIDATPHLRVIELCHS